MKWIPSWRLKTGSMESRRLATEFCLDAQDVANMFGVTRAIVYVWTKRGRYGFVLTSRRELRQERSSVSFRVLDVQSFAWQQNLKLDYSVLHPLLLARLKIKLDDNGVALDNDARVVE